MLTVNGWSLFAHPLLLNQVEKMTAALERAQAKDPQGFRNTPNAKVLGAVKTLIFENIPGDPTRKEYRQGNTLGPNRKHWFRAKFGNGRFRLFFRYDSRAKVIVLAWVNDQDTLRTYGSQTDAYATFKRMLDGGNPPDDRKALLAAASSDDAQKRLADTLEQSPPPPH